MAPPPRVDPARPLWIFGAGSFGRGMSAALRSQGFDVQGFIETAPRQQRLMDLPVKCWAALDAADKRAQLLVCIFNRATPLDELESIARAAGFADVLLPWHIYAEFGHSNWAGATYWLSGPDSISAHLDELERAHAFFTDAQSQACLRDICRFRLGLHTAYASFRHAERQYFNELTLGAAMPSAVRYVDGGAFNGDTLVELAGLRTIESAYLFEPDAANFSALQGTVRASGLAAHSLPLALSDSYQILSFNGGGGEAAAISSTGNSHIAAMALDDLLPTQTVDFIKLDVEGAELAALNGASRLIERCRPTLALSFYHRVQDLWELPAWLAVHCPDYDFALRQHYFNTFDSVLYAVPRRH
jgi:FkbM family methyltransferase